MGRCPQPGAAGWRAARRRPAEHASAARLDDAHAVRGSAATIAAAATVAALAALALSAAALAAALAAIAPAAAVTATTWTGSAPRPPWACSTPAATS